MFPYDKDRFGAALRYNSEDELPRIVSAVRGELVDKMLSIAEENDIPVYKDPVLSRLLVKEGEGGFVPEELFPAVAEVLAYCYRIDADFREKIAVREGGRS